MKKSHLNHQKTSKHDETEQEKSSDPGTENQKMVRKRLKRRITENNKEECIRLEEWKMGRM